MAADRTPNPIMVRCEGSLTPTAFFQTGSTICRMCGHTVHAFGADAVAVEHDRVDVVAMVLRGDFDA